MNCFDFQICSETLKLVHLKGLAIQNVIWSASRDQAYRNDIVDDLERQFQLQFYRLDKKRKIIRQDKIMTVLKKRLSVLSRAPRWAIFTTDKTDKLTISDE